MKAGPKKGSSFVWQSVVASLHTFKRGHIWRIGSGSKVSIWEDHWIPRKVLSRCGSSLLQTVDELIDLYTGNWGEVLIRENLLQTDAERILQIPLSEHHTEDFIA